MSSLFPTTPPSPAINILSWLWIMQLICSMVCLSFLSVCYTCLFVFYFCLFLLLVCYIWLLCLSVGFNCLLCLYLDISYVCLYVCMFIMTFHCMFVGLIFYMSVLYVISVMSIISAMSVVMSVCCYACVSVMYVYQSVCPFIITFRCMFVCLHFNLPLYMSVMFVMSVMSI